MKTKFSPCCFSIGNWSCCTRTELLSEMHFPSSVDSLGICVGASLQVYVESHVYIGYHFIYLIVVSSQNNREEDGMLWNIWEFLRPNFEPEGKINRNEICGDIK